MGMLGMDADQIDNLAGQLHQQSAAIEHVITAINNLVNQMESVWKGQDATEFQGWWASQHMPALRNAQQAIEGLATSAKNNASAQRGVSGKA